MHALTASLPRNYTEKSAGVPPIKFSTFTETRGRARSVGQMLAVLEEGHMLLQANSLLRRENIGSSL
jgi:hypothetical protein